MKKLGIFILFALIVEIAFTWFLSHWISGWLIFWWTLVALVVGINMVRTNIAALMPAMQGLQGGQIKDASLAKPLIKVFAGILLAFPGVFGDIVALMLLLPPVQALFQKSIKSIVKKQQDKFVNQMFAGAGVNMGTGAGTGADVMTELQKRMQEMQRQFRGQHAANADIIDVTATEVKEKQTGAQITHQK